MLDLEPRTRRRSAHARAHTPRARRREERAALPRLRRGLARAQRRETHRNRRTLRPDRAEGWTQARRVEH